ncbi:helix-turn-helix domain-containing protein [Edaphobacillus lindanitolerans]|uniref:DNA-binding transcriptional regulator, XRE-family HTH domain n=1 Tax=Edaphobacillus lindanitolerans TaxID=550447 RepID=A0A1U7PT55_9BACI|nr:helix-turn-helix domain-containing protein [Edaphobacillus lindanitolerans]SIT91488.1 DNA-binding transcriptional regulator, XRE-family HTH domain [Edaphobacillus lindanitolerans]
MLIKRLRSLRMKEKLTQAQMAEKIGVARTTYAMYEQGKREPDNETLAKIADYFGVTTDYLLGRTDEPVQPKHVQVGVSNEDYHSLSPYQKEVLDFMLASETLAFHDQPEDLLEALEDFEVYYEVWKKRRNKDK